MPKNLVICCDGTNNEFGEENTNVVRICSLANNDPNRQVTFYDPGVGTFSSSAALTPFAKWITKKLGSGFGYGVSTNIADVYEFLIDNYTAQDRVFMFGFSRGAYQVRAVAALVYCCGLLRRPHKNLIPYAIELFRSEWRKRRLWHKSEPTKFIEPDELMPLCAEFQKQFSSPLQIHFLGLWDTVTSVGSLYNPLKLPYTTTNPSVLTVRHAVAIDERRKFFRHNLWKASPEQDLKQVWFAGAHADIGGGYPEDQSGLAKITLAWMLDEAKDKGFVVDPAAVPGILPSSASVPTPVPANSLAMKHDELDHLSWKLAQLVPRFGGFDKTWTISPLPKERYIPAGSVIHRSVLERFRRDGKYRPKNLLKLKKAFTEDGRRIRFVKDGRVEEVKEEALVAPR